MKKRKNNNIILMYMGLFGNLFNKKDKDEPKLEIVSETIDQNPKVSVMSKENIILGLLDLEEQNANQDEIKKFMRDNKASEDIVDIYFEKDANALSDFKSPKDDRVMDLRNALPRGRETPRDPNWNKGRDERNLGKDEEIAGGSIIGGALAGGNALAGAVAGAGGAGLAGEILSEEGDKIIGGDGTLGGNQRPPMDFIGAGYDEDNPQGDVNPKRDFLEGGADAVGGMGNFAGMSGMKQEPLLPRQEQQQEEQEEKPRSNSEWFNSLTPEQQGATARYNRDKGLLFDTNPETSRTIPDEPTENNDLVTTQEHHETTDNNVIQDETLDFEHIGGSRSNFDNNFVGFVLKECISKSVNQLSKNPKSMETDLRNSLNEEATETLPEFYETLRKKGLTKEYNRIITNVNNKLTTPTIPLVVVILYLYMVDRSSDFKININFVEGYFIKMVLKEYLGFDEKNVIFGMDIISKIPKELTSAYLKQKGTQEEIISVNEVIEITYFTQYINMEYRKRFNKELKNELFKYENKQSLYLYEMLETLSSSSTLFQISSAFNTINTIIVEMIDNPYLLVQLIALVYNEVEGRNLPNSDILSRGKIDKYIYYYSDLQGGVKENEKVSILKNVLLKPDDRGKVKGMTIIQNSDKTALYKYKDKYYIAFSGSDLKDNKDFLSNVLNFGGKDLLNNPQFDRRIKTGKSYLDLAIIKSRQEGLEPPVVLGYSIGAVSSLYLSTLYPNIETDVYSPVLSKDELTENIMDYLGNSNIHFNYNEKDPISKNMPYYQEKYPNLDINKFSYNKFYTPHSLGHYN